ncbi:hypothetical protein [Neobacillus sp. OS1-33]|uniref:hypothetical protein n=1 Tax=Neobacillus sp. OS1-33 TaxID=3070683 RepID=UPI0027DF42D0|nr:hypothetical protein [Neobacillus sp. OS1-33]WML24110.1 hypothetical protein RCG22_14205 [Neobacillus sp. OS1-33]
MSDAIDALETEQESEENHWYKLIDDNSLEQGDVLENISIAMPSPEFYIGKSKRVGMKATNVIILTQTCDLANAKTPWVYVTPVRSIEVFKKQYASQEQSEEQINKHLENIRRGNMPKYHMINQCNLEPLRLDISILDLREVYSLPFKYVKEFANQGERRRRMLSPYKEHLGQAYARFFMRIGLPGDIPPFFDLGDS